MSQLPNLSDPTYQIEAELGSGGGSVVYKAWHTRLQKYVVLKRIKDESGLIQSGLQRGEVDILKNLKHTYLPQLYDFLDDPSGVYTVIEFIPGRSFAELLKETQRFEQKEVILWAEQLSGALAYLHGQHPTVLHSDIKPANIMLTPTGDVCLIDFNISLVLDGDETKALGLSHGYASPEQYAVPGPPAQTQVPRAPVSSAHDNEPAMTELDAGHADSSMTELDAGHAGSAITELDTGYAGSSKTELSTGNTTDLRVDRPGSPASQSALAPLLQSIPPTPAPQPQASPSTSAPQRHKRTRGDSQARGQGSSMLDARSDIYSFGATLYHLLTGERPAKATGKTKPLREFNDLPLSDAFIYIIDRCMENDPAKRFQTAADLHDAIANIHKLDKRWKRQRVKTTVTLIVLFALLVAFSATAVFGMSLMSSEKLEKYNAYVLSIISDDETNGGLSPGSGAPGTGGSAFESAVQLFPEKPDAYREQALKLYKNGLYEECIEFVKGAMAKLSAYNHGTDALRMIGHIYYTQANAYFELERFPDSLPAYEAAIGNNPDAPEIYRDYAITLARCGYIDRAEELLNETRVINLGNDSLDLLRGEIAFAKGDNETAIQLFKSVIKETGDPLIRSRAYMICILAYRRVPEQVKSEIAFLREALTGLTDNYSLIVKERLADALVRADEYAEAVALYEELRRSGNLSYYTWQNIGVLYQQMGDMVGARAVYLELVEAYPGDYRPPMRLAFLSLQEQAALSNEERDYGETALWHDKALQLYDKRPQSASDDAEMSLLDSLIGELRLNGWID